METKRNTGYKSQYKREIETVHEASKYMSEFDGCILFDEAHKAKEFVQLWGNTHHTQAWLSRNCKRLPHARDLCIAALLVATVDPNHVGYMMRMNLWGRGQAFQGLRPFQEKHGAGKYDGARGNTHEA